MARQWHDPGHRHRLRCGRCGCARGPRSQPRDRPDSPPGGSRPAGRRGGPRVSRRGSAGNNERSYGRAGGGGGAGPADRGQADAAVAESITGGLVAQPWPACGGIRGVPRRGGGLRDRLAALLRVDAGLPGPPGRWTPAWRGHDPGRGNGSARRRGPHPGVPGPDDGQRWAHLHRGGRKPGPAIRRLACPERETKSAVRRRQNACVCFLPHSGKRMCNYSVTAADTPQYGLPYCP
jgi:hypothetical protein